jgi:glutamine amidotransferase
MPTISILDTKSANFHSVKKAVDLYETDNLITSSREQVLDSKALIIPGVSSTDTVLNNIYKSKLDETILEFYELGKPILCICVGMQILFESSEEGHLPGLGIVEGRVSRIPEVDKNKNKYKIPHMGWNQVETTKKSKLFKNIQNKSDFYFVHSFQCIPNDQNIISGKTNYSEEIVASIEKNNLYAVQFHPEKSSSIGLKIYENFINLTRKN